MLDNQFSRDASSRLTFEMFRVPCTSYPTICTEISAAFGLTRSTPFSAGLDVVFQDYQRGEASVGLAWDNWTGFMVFAKNSVAEQLVQQIATYLLASSWGSAAVSR